MQAVRVRTVERVRHWFADGAFRAILRNAGYLASSKVLGAPLGLLALALTGRALPIAVFGTLMVIHAYASAVGDLVKFQTWQFIVRYATPALQRGQRAMAVDVIRFSLGLDIASGIVGMAVAMALLPLLGHRLGIARPDMMLALAYCTLVPTMSAATATGVLRVLDRFDLIARQQLATPAIRALGAVIASAAHLGFAGFVVTWYVADLTGDLILWGMAARELRRQGMAAAFRPGLFAPARSVPGAWGFVWTTNLAHSVYSAWGPLSNLVVASILGPAAAGLYKIASTLLDGVSKPADLLARGFYPEIMRLDPAERRPWQLALRTGAIAAAIGLAFVAIVAIGGRPVIAAAFGRKYVESFDVLRLMTAALVVSMGTFPLESLLYMVGRQRAALLAQAAAVIAYMAVLALLTRWLGLTGAGIAYVVGALLMALFMLLPTLASYRRRGPAPSVASPRASG